MSNKKRKKMIIKNVLIFFAQKLVRKGSIKNFFSLNEQLGYDDVTRSL